jgi:hypothetical protein
MMQEPTTYAWLIPGRLAIAERPGGGGRSHRIARREAELAWWAAQGVTTIVSGMRSRHGLVEAALAGFHIVWHPLVSVEQAAREVRALVAAVRERLDARGEVVLVHVDRAGEWLAGVDAALRMGFGLARTRPEALAQAAGDGLAVSEISSALVGGAVGRRRAGVAA